MSLRVNKECSKFADHVSDCGKIDISFISFTLSDVSICIEGAMQYKIQLIGVDSDGVN